MLTGFSGHLVSEGFLERYLADQGPRDLASQHRRFSAWRRGCRGLGPTSSLRALVDVGLDPLARVLRLAPGPFDLRQGIALSVARTASHPGALVAPVAPVAPVALVACGWGERLDPLWRKALVHAHAHAAVWALLFNGTHLRLVDAARPYSRRFVQFDLDIVRDDDRTFAALWAFEHLLNTDAARGLNALVAASEQHGVSVCRSLRSGVLTASADILGALLARSSGATVITGITGVTGAGAFEQALTIVYRILFLLFAEARGLVPLWHPVYRDGYSMAGLCASVGRGDDVPGVWDALAATSRLAHAGCRAGDLRVTPFNGRLFNPSRTPLAEQRELDNAAATRALVGLTTRLAADRAGREPIQYRDLGVEQLGAIYETLLDYEAHVVRPPRARGRGPALSVSLKRGSEVRKATGTFYTPEPLARYLVRRTLGPLVKDRTPDEILALRVLDPAAGSGAFLVAACRFLSQAYEDALVQNGDCRAGDLGRDDQTSFRRTIAERCLYGVDLNPMAVQLARLSLWLTTLAADRPLTFLDHHLLVGDSLLGAWVRALRRPPEARARTGATLPLFDDQAVGDTLRATLPVRFSLASVPDDTIQQVRSKESALATLCRRDSALSAWKRVADLWCARWFARNPPPASAFSTLADAILTGTSALSAVTVREHLQASEDAAAAARFFHWELEFPEVFFNGDGTRRDRAGFDAVVGNPPWEMLRGDRGTVDARALAKVDAGQTTRFSRQSGLYASQSGGHANRYQLFVERAVALTRPGGRVGLVLPSGLATDHGSAGLRRLLFTHCDVDAIVGFDNRRGVFPIHRSVRFLLLTATTGRPTTSVDCRLGEQDPAVLEESDAQPHLSTNGENRERRPPVVVTPALLRRISGNDLALPDFRAPTDLAIVERSASLFPALGDDRGWGARFGRELNASDDRDAFVSQRRGLPVVEGKHVDPFGVRVDDARWHIHSREAARRLGGRHDRPRLAYRDVAGASNRLTLIAAILPAGCVSTHTVFCLRTTLPLAAQQFLCGLFNSFVLNYLVRLRVNTHVTTAVVEHLPIPTLDMAPAAFEEIAGLARQLGRRPDPGALAQLNGRVAVLYQLSREEFAHILGTFPLVPHEDRAAALTAFDERELI